MPTTTRGARRKSLGLPPKEKQERFDPSSPSKSRTGKKAEGWGAPARTGFWANVYGTCGVLAIIGTTPFIAVIVWHMFVDLDGSLASIVAAFREDGLSLISKIWPWTSKRAWQLLGSYAAFEAILQVYMPGKRFEANPTAAGNVPVYKANGVQSLIATAIAFFACWHFGLTTPTEVYSLFGEMLAGMSVLAIVFCVFLLVKGHVAPTDEDSGSCGNMVYDFWWGMELYPKLGPLNLKQFTNCRFGIEYWKGLVGGEEEIKEIVRKLMKMKNCEG